MFDTMIQMPQNYIYKYMYRSSSIVIVGSKKLRLPGSRHICRSLCPETENRNKKSEFESTRYIAPGEDFLSGVKHKSDKSSTGSSRLFRTLPLYFMNKNLSINHLNHFPISAMPSSALSDTPS